MTTNPLQLLELHNLHQLRKKLQSDMGINSPSVITSGEVRLESWKSAVAGLTNDTILFYRCEHS